MLTHEHQTEVVDGWIFDVVDCLHDPDERRGSPTWSDFGGTGCAMDRELGSKREYEMLLLHLKMLLFHCLDDCPPDTPQAPCQLRKVTVLCAWGRHRSRKLASDAARDVFARRQARCPGLRIAVEHLSDRQRQREIDYASMLMSRHRYSNRDAIRSAKTAGFRRKRSLFHSFWEACQSRAHAGMYLPMHERRLLDVVPQYWTLLSPGLEPRPVEERQPPAAQAHRVKCLGDVQENMFKTTHSEKRR